MDHIYYTFDRFTRDINTIAEKIGSQKFDIIVGLNRGGCIPAVTLSHKLKIPATMLNLSTRDGVTTELNIYRYFENLSEKFFRILVVDDLVDSGKTVQWVCNTSQIFCHTSLATLLHNTDVKMNVDHYFGTPFTRTLERRYFDFWWEKM